MRGEHPGIRVGAQDQTLVLVEIEADRRREFDRDGMRLIFEQGEANGAEPIRWRYKQRPGCRKTAAKGGARTATLPVALISRLC